MPTSRIQQARLAAGLSLQKVVERLPESLRVSRAALHKYETGASMPSARMLMALGRLYGVPAHEFLVPPTITFEWLAFRRHRGLGSRVVESLKATAEQRAERHLQLERKVMGPRAHRFPEPVKARTAADAEAAAAAVRRAWRLGEAPIESLTETVESHGGVVVDLANTPDKFHGLSGRADGVHPVIVVRTDAPADRRRFTIAHELGHLCLESAAGRDEETFAHRFASAFLLPAEVVRRELGATRKRLDWDELLLLKRRYGVSVQAWLRRAADLEIITHGSYTNACRAISAKGWRTTEPAVYDAERPSNRLEQLVRRALAEDILSLDEARRIWPGVEAGAPPRVAGRMRASEIMRLPPAERDAIMLRAAERAAPEYASGAIEQFEAFGDADLIDDDSED